MKTVVRRSLTILMCAGTLIAGTQSWANDAKDLSNSKSNAVTTAKKAQEPCSKPCKMNKNNKVQQEPSQQQAANSSDMSKMDHSMMNMDHSKMDHSKMNMPGSNK
ncbi:hypothetical protein N5J44_14775 [Acinetobacter ursingii]|uniref:hypothetical protein n=1 Tax=Acinetobacter ursingii TaxID=108980 RepID=UPI002448212B|nr:hypothetical protein [Acinetobacter ursingii]MDH2020489.1 hypothetical protein [Acinetobacter ursingii]MDH2072791.1 hypothetical protein [Acinetobacter ursingii]